MMGTNDESKDLFDLSGPFAEGIKSFHESQLVTFSGRIRAERNSPHPLNPVGQFKRIVSFGSQGSLDALLVLSNQFLEIFTIVSEAHQQHNPKEKATHGANLTRRLKSVASSAGHAINVATRSKTRTADTEGIDSFLEDAMPEEMEKVQEILKDHVLSVGVALGQVLKIRMSGTELTVFYHPNERKGVKVGKVLSGAMRFSFCAETAENAKRVMEALETKINRFNMAMLFLSSDMVLPAEMHVIAVTRPMTGRESMKNAEEEVVVAKDPRWGTTVPSPPGWGPQATESNEPLWVYLSTPLGGGQTAIIPNIVAQYAKNGHASFYVGVKHRQVQGSTLASVSYLQRVSTLEREREAADLEEDDGSDESWQPEHTAESFGRSRLDNSLSRKSETGKITLLNGRNGQHVRLHCYATYIGHRKPSSSTQRSRKSSRPSSMTKQQPGSGVMLALSALILLAGLLGYPWTAFMLLLALFIVYTNYSDSPLLVFQNSSSSTSETHLQSQPIQQTELPDWEIILVKAEVITGETWKEHGESVVAKVEADDSEEAVDNRKAALSQQFGFSDDEVDRYLLAFHGDEAIAYTRMSQTFEWRKEAGAVDILHQKAPHFKFFKQMFHHALLGTTKDGHPIWFMKVGDMKSGFKTYKQSQLSSRDLARHVALCMDYLYHVVETSSLPEGRALWILDLKGMGLTDIGSEAFDLGKEIAGLISAHWPERLYRAFVINMPGFFSVLWKLIEPMMAATTRRKIRLLRGKENMIKEMTEEMSLDDIPVAYGGRLADVYDAPKEREFWEYVESL